MPALSEAEDSDVTLPAGTTGTACTSSTDGCRASLSRFGFIRAKKTVPSPMKATPAFFSPLSERGKIEGERPSTYAGSVRSKRVMSFRRSVSPVSVSLLKSAEASMGA